ncbi:MAG: hypothetical protein ABI954_03280, partial [Pyrinomonadaceae bacterium]
MKSCWGSFTFFRVTALFMLLFCCNTVLFAAAPAHPLDPLDTAEITSAVKILQAAPNFPKNALF